MVAMTRIQYITPTLELLSIHFDEVVCVLSTSPDPFEDNGDYDWGQG